MTRISLKLPGRSRKQTLPDAFADKYAARRCGACARRDSTALVVEGVSHAYADGVQVLHDVSFCLHAGEIVALVGPSGCGKTTTLRLAAGLERLQTGFIRVGEALAAAPGRHMPAEDRDVGMMFQDYALFPHLSVEGNVAFGLGDLPAAERRRRALEALADVGMDHLADRSPATLSGGQQQRVALARALAPRPKALLLDEPFSGLDTELRRKVRGEAIRLLKAAGAGALMVTHDPEEALFMAERIAVMREGRIEQMGPPRALYETPASLYVARLFSETNEFPAMVAGGRAETPLGAVPAAGLADGEAAVVMARPEHLAIGEAALATGRSIEARVGFARWLGRTALIEARLPDGTEVLVRTPARLWPEEGAAIDVALDPERALCFQADGSAAAAPATPQRDPLETLAIQAALR